VVVSLKACDGTWCKACGTWCASFKRSVSERDIRGDSRCTCGTWCASLIRSVSFKACDFRDIRGVPKYASIQPKCVVLNGLMEMVSNTKSNLLQQIMCDSAHVRSSRVGQYLARFSLTWGRNWYDHKSSSSISMYLVIAAYFWRRARIAGIVVLQP